MKQLIILILSLILTIPLYSQKTLLDNKKILDVIYDGLTSMYGYKFGPANEALDQVRKEYPDHPVTPFFEALITYWEYYPLIPGETQADKFVSLMEECISRSEKLLDKNEDDIEGVFFDLFGRAFYVMFWSDNGKSGKVYPYLNQMYKETLKGFEMKDNFNEFYFTCGLYNYYIEAYPQNHPIYKPLTLFFKKGDRELGLKQLNYCAQNSVFLRVEAKFFLALIYLNYENDVKTAQEYAAALYKEFPGNPYYTGTYIELLLYNHKYFFVPILLDHLADMKDDFAHMQWQLFRALYAEKSEHKQEEAFNDYIQALEHAEQYGPIANHYMAIACMGLGRYYKVNHNHSKASEYFKKARDVTSYKYILNDK